MQGSGLLAVFVVVTRVSSNVTQWTWARSDSDLRVSAALTEAAVRLPGMHWHPASVGTGHSEDTRESAGGHRSGLT